MHRLRDAVPLGILQHPAQSDWLCFSLLLIHGEAVQHIHDNKRNNKTKTKVKSTGNSIRAILKAVRQERDGGTTTTTKRKDIYIRDVCRPAPFIMYSCVGVAAIHAKERTDSISRTSTSLSHHAPGAGKA